MNRDPHDSFALRCLCRAYGWSLRLYPRAHRRRWGTEMQLAFRDRCREARRDGRLWRLLLGECLPDLVVSVGRERTDAVTTLPPRQRLLLAGLLGLAAAAVVFHTRLGDGAVAMKDAWDQYQQRLDNRAWRGYQGELAAAVERRGGAHADVLAAQLYFSAGDGFSLRDPQAGQPALSHAQGASVNALLVKADTAFARALRADDRWALWLASTQCPAQASVCVAADSFARLREFDAENGVVWLLELARARQAGDNARARMALARMAAATRYDWHYGDAVDSYLAAAKLSPLPHRLRQTWYGDGGTADAADSASLWALSQAAITTAITQPGTQPVFDLCRSTAADIRNDCRAVAIAMADRSDTLIGHQLGLGLWKQMAVGDERSQVLRQVADGRWLLARMVEVLPELSADALHRWLDAWHSERNETAVYQRLLRERSIPLQAPAGYLSATPP
ncbi:MAG: hypothetical protein JSS45_08780 [Proteobacteria bacterium]|nr:hypothetical protein [Pseudomonadota bacterium]